jgi:hypothetical protein
MSLAALWPWLENLPLAMSIGESWWFPLLESIHVLTATFLVGSILMVDLRLLGLAATNYPVSRVVKETVPWTYSASVISVITGLGMFITRASHYVDNRAFQIKLLLLVLAGLNMAFFHLATSRRISHRDAAVVASTGARLAGASSLLLWIGVMLAGRWIGHLN